MNWKQFLKPDWKKIVMTYLITNLLTSIMFYFGASYFFYAVIFSTIIPTILYADVFYSVITVIIFLFVLTISYFLSCFIIWVYGKYRKKKK